MITNLQSELALDFLWDKISIEDLFAGFNSDVQSILKLFWDDAIENKSALSLDTWLALSGKFGLEISLNILIKLANESWHTSHENLVDWLEDYKNCDDAAATLGALAVSNIGYRSFDVTESLARKCIYALDNMSVFTAQYELEKLAENQNLIISALAKKMLSESSE